MGSPNAWIVLPVLIGLADLIVALCVLELSEEKTRIQPTKSFFLRRKQITGAANAAPREIRRQHRRPTTQIPRTYGNCTAEMLARSIHSSGRVPIGRYRHRPWRLSFWRTTGLLFVPSSTNPKSAFTLTDWEYQPITPTGPAKHYPYTGGSMLRLSLHPHENRSHLKRSLNADKSGRRTRRLLVIASAKDMLEPTSWVRCIVVDSNTLQREEGDPHAAVIRTADPLSVEGPTVHQRKQKEVPADALWLIVPESKYLAPSKSWGQMPECHNNQTMPTDPITEKSDDTDIRQYVKKRKASLWIARFVMWFYFGVFVPGSFGLYTKLTSQFSLPEIAFVVWYAVYFTALTATVARLIVTAIKACCWRCRDGQTRRTWQSRTQECLFMGTPLRFGPLFSEKEWKEYYAHVFHTSDGDPTGSA